MKPLEKIQGNDLIQGVVKLIMTGRYGKALLFNDMSAALIVTLMLIPQSLAYALVAGLPAEAGLYASILPLIAYALFGTSAALAVGPVAIISLLTLNTLTPFAEVGSQAYADLALLLALLVGFFYFIMGVFRLGFVTQLLSYPVMKGFITASSLLIIIGQIKPLTGIYMSGGNLLERIHTLDITTLHFGSTLMGGLAVIILFSARSKTGSAFIDKVFTRYGQLFRRLLPMFLILIATIISAMFKLDATGLATVGALPRGLPSLHLPYFDLAMIQQLILPAFIITLIGMTESIAVAQTLGGAKRQRISANRELLGIGAANIAASFSGGFPVTGGMSRSVVNADAGAQTPLAGALTAIFLSIGILFLTPWLAFIPIPVLAATIIVAVSQLLEFPSMFKLLRMNKLDGAISWLTAALVLVWEVEAGLMVGVAASIMVMLANHRSPFMAVVGLIPNTERFKNINHAQTQTLTHSVFLRIDESLTFLNSKVVEQEILSQIAQSPDMKNLVIVSAGIHTIDASGANMLKRMQQELASVGIELYLSDVKVPLAKHLQAFEVLKTKPENSKLSTIELYRQLNTAP